VTSTVRQAEQNRIILRLGRELSVVAFSERESSDLCGDKEPRSTLIKREVWCSWRWLNCKISCVPIHVVARSGSEAMVGDGVMCVMMG